MKNETSIKTRIEKDSLGEINVPIDCYWGAQTQRSLEHFPIALDRFCWQRPVIRALALIKKAAAQSNHALGLLTDDVANSIVSVADEIIAGNLDKHFPLGVFQTGSGTHSNMNINEVIANRANKLLSQDKESQQLIHPNDHVNLGQSSNDVFPSAMHIVVLEQLQNQLLPAIKQLQCTLKSKQQEYKNLVKTGRTHLQDAAPLTLGQEISAWVAQLDFVLQVFDSHKQYLYPLAIGGTAVGTGLNAHPKFAEKVILNLSEATDIEFTQAENKFFALSTHDPLVEMSGGLRTCATVLLKIVNDIRWLGSGPNGGIAELILPENESGSSIMPGKINPTQCEALSMVCVQVFGNDASVAFAGSQGNFQLNVYKPIILHNILESISLLSDATISFDTFCAQGIAPNIPVIEQHLNHNLMLATALVNHIGYDKATEVSKLAYKKSCSVKEACLLLGYANEDQYSQWVDVNVLVGLTS
jgi:fumarate hydratase class II